MNEPKTLVGDVRKRRLKRVKVLLGRHRKLSLLALVTVIMAGAYGAYQLSRDTPIPQKNIATANIHDAETNQKLLDQTKQVDTEALDGPGKMALYSNQSLLYIAKQDFQSAYEVLKKAEAIKNDDPATMMNLGLVLARMNRGSEAKPYYERALAAYQKLAAGGHDVNDTINRIKQELSKL